MDKLKNSESEKIVILNMTFQKAMQKSLSTPLKDSKVNQDNNKTKKAKKKS